MPTSFRSASAFGWGSNRRAKSARSSARATAPGYKNVCDTFNRKISSYRTLCGQASGPAKGTRPSPATLNTMSKWIEKGAVVQKVSAAQVRRMGRSAQPVKSATTAKNVLCRKYGKSAIKAVAPAKSGAFLVACTPSVHFPR